ncbi:MAG: SurA N-terminal domain-containing protein, partial [Deltaproteobacteria bacterium]|nr:SurA N-terminal domain-containing protein [Deltaproteobacteria bacterium]
MLDILRKRKRSWIIVFLIGMIVVVFALWGVGSYVNDSGQTNVAVVNGEALTPREFEVHYQRFLENYRNLFREALTDEMIRNLNLKGAVLEELVQKRLLLQEAERLGLVVGDEELRDEIARVPVFTVDGRFSKSRYLQALRSSRLTPAAFEAEQREQLTMQRLYAVIRDSVQVAEAELRDRYRLRGEKLDLHFIRISADQFLSGVKVTADEVKSYYERNRESFREPPRAQVEYVSYPFEHFAA